MGNDQLEGPLSRTHQAIKFIAQIAWTALLVFVSWVCGRPLQGHQLKIGQVSFRKLALYDVYYAGALYDEEYTFTFAAPCLCFRPLLPTPSHPAWLVLTAHAIFYKSTTCDASLARLDATCWLFPYLLKRTAGPWVSAELDELRIRVHHSDAMPYWVHRLRQNVAGAVLGGEIFRLDDARAAVRFSGLSEPPAPPHKPRKPAARQRPLDAVCPAPGSCAYAGVEEDGSECADDDDSDDDGEREADPADHDDPPPPFLNGATDEMRVSVSARQMHLHNTAGRVYTFGTVELQVRRDWGASRGSFVLVAEECRWVRVHRAAQREYTPWWTQFFTSVAQFPFDLFCVLSCPMSAVDLYVRRADVVFDEFRIRDAELAKQGLALLREKTTMFEVNWGNAVFDAVAKAIITS